MRQQQRQPRFPVAAALTGVLAVAFNTALAWPAAAAPLDALLTALPEHTAPNGSIELGLDRLNGHLDFLNARASDPSAAGTTAGDYSGSHLAGSLRLRDGLWLSGSLWQRNIGDGADTYRYGSWQLSGLYRFLDAAGARPALALRLSAWGNRAGETYSSTPIHVPGAVLTTATVTRPADRQLQADLIGTWPVSEALDLNASLGAGTVRLSYGGLAATTVRNGCNYRLAFNGNDIFGTLMPPCDAGGGVITQFYDSSGEYGVDVAHEIAWRGRFAQAGLNAAWRSGPWTLRGGYLFHAVQRESVDDILAARGDPVHRHNHLVALQGDYAVSENLALFLRTQVSSNLFFNDIPVTYNSSTSSHFGSRYSLYTFGLRAGF